MSLDVRWKLCVFCLGMDHYKSDSGGRSKIKNFPQVIINKKYIFLSILAKKKYMPKEEKKISTLHVQKKSCSS